GTGEASARAWPRVASASATPRSSSRSSLAFTLDTGAPAPAVNGSRLATLVTAHTARAFGGNRGRATAVAVARVSRTLGATGWRRWSPPERRAFERLATLVGLIPDPAGGPAPGPE